MMDTFLVNVCMYVCKKFERKGVEKRRKMSEHWKEGGEKGGKTEKIKSSVHNTTTD